MTDTAPPTDRQQLRDRIAQAIASVTITIGPNSLALLKNGNTLGLTSGEIDAMALSALAAIQPELDRLALLDAGVQEREALLTEARDLLEPYGGHADGWPAIAPAISTLLAEVARLRAELAKRDDQLINLRAELSQLRGCPEHGHDCEPDDHIDPHTHQ